MVNSYGNISCTFVNAKYMYFKINIETSKENNDYGKMFDEEVDMDGFEEIVLIDEYFLEIHR